MYKNKILFLVIFSLASYGAHLAIPEASSSVEREKVVAAEAQAKGTITDVEVTRKLRERLMADDQLSTNAQNIKIVTVKDAITLQGPVASRAEKVKIENFARAMAGKKKVYNRLTY
ncbi:MAG: BON domain-containing protein [Bacteriovorax sp.]